MGELRYADGIIYDDNREIAHISRSQSGIRTSSIEITGQYNFSIVRKSSGTFSIYRNGTEIGEEKRGLSIYLDGQTYGIRMGELSAFIGGNSDMVKISSGSLEVGTIYRKGNSLIATSDFNREILIIYIAFLSPYVSPVAVPTYFAGRYPAKREYRQLALLFAVLSLVFLLIPAIDRRAPVLLMFALFVVFAVMSFLARYLGRRKYRQERESVK